MRQGDDSEFERRGHGGHLDMGFSLRGMKYGCIHACCSQVSLGTQCVYVYIYIIIFIIIIISIIQYVYIQ